MSKDELLFRDRLTGFKPCECGGSPASVVGPVAQEYDADLDMYVLSGSVECSAGRIHKTLVMVTPKKYKGI
jgi:hypothetical protein